MKNNYVATFIEFLKQLNVPVSKTSAAFFLETHPDLGSLYAYTEALHHFNIDNAAIRVKAEELNTLPTPFVAFSRHNGGTYSVIKQFSGHSIERYDTEVGWVSDPLEDFAKTWSGIVLLAEPNEQSGEKNFAEIRQKERFEGIRLPLALLGVALVLLYFIFNVPQGDVPIFLLLGLKLVGMVVCSLLLLKSLDSSSDLVNKICSIGSKVSCQTILDSPAAQITSWLSWSDAGFIYFFGSFFGLLISLYASPESLGTFWTCQAVFSLFALIFSSYSLYYQGQIARIWCTLCLSVVLVFFLEAGLLASIYDLNQRALKLPGLAGLGVGFLIPIVWLLFFKKTYGQANEVSSLKKELVKLKRNPTVFEALMVNQKQMPPIPADMPVLTLGNPEAEHTITLVSNPLCSPCAKMHKRLEKVLEENDQVKCQLIFQCKAGGLDGQVVQRFFNLPESLVPEAMHEWYERNDRNVVAWNKKYTQFPEELEIHHIARLHQEWISAAEVEGTPTIYLNGQQLSDFLKIEDIVYGTVFLSSSSR